MAPIQIRYRLSEPEFMSACNAHWAARREGRISNALIGLFAIALGLVLIDFMFWVAVISLLAGGVLVLVVLGRSIIWRRFYREAKKYNGDISVTIDEETIHVESGEGTSDLNWSFFTWFLDTPDYILLYTTKRQFSIIPKTSFPNSESVQNFLRLVTKKLQKIGD